MIDPRPACDCTTAPPATGRRDTARRTVLAAFGATARLTGRKRHPSLPTRPRLLLIRPDHLGDVLLTSPAIEMLRKALPDAHLTMMVGPWSEDVAMRDSLVDEVAICQFPGFTRALKGSLLEPYRLLVSVASTLRSRSYDAALILRFDHWWGAWLAALAGIPLRAGYGTPECRPFLTHLVDPLPHEQWVERSLRVVGRLLMACGVAVPETRFPLRFGLREQDEAEAGHLWDDLGFGGGRTAVIHPGSGAALKLWPEDRWVGVGRSLAAKSVQLLVTGSESEAAAAERIARGVPGARSLAGRTDVGVLAALFRRCDLVAGVDSGPLHLAVAMDVPSVHLFGPTDPVVYGPWGNPMLHRVVTAEWPGSPCGRLDLLPLDGESPSCMKAISTEQVLNECLSLLDMRG